MNIPTPFKKLLFFWASSFILATLGYYILWLIMPRHMVFGSWYRMILYHKGYPISFIAIPCFFYGILAVLFETKICIQNRYKSFLWALVIVLLTILFSSPFGGMLWHYYNMQAGHFPENWVSVMMKLGFVWGLELGWVIILLSFPYNMLGIIVCYKLTKRGATLFKKC